MPYNFLSRGLAKLTCNGGRGQPGIALIDGSVLTMRETAAKSIAIQVKAQVESSATSKPFIDWTIFELAPLASGMADNKGCSDADVLRELMAMQNHLKYAGQGT